MHILEKACMTGGRRLCLDESASYRPMGWSWNVLRQQTRLVLVMGAFWH